VAVHGPAAVCEGANFQTLATPLLVAVKKTTAVIIISPCCSKVATNNK